MHYLEQGNARTEGASPSMIHAYKIPSLILLVKYIIKKEGI